MSWTSCSTRSRGALEAADELSARPSPARPPTPSRRSCPRSSATWSRADHRSTRRSGDRLPRTRPPNGSAGPRRSPISDAARRPRSWSCATNCANAGSPHRARRHGRLVARARGHHAHLRGAAHRARRHRSRAGALGDRDRLAKTAVVISSKSGSTVETDSQKRVYEQAFRDAGIDPTDAHHRRHRPGISARRRRRADGLPRVQRRSERRRPLFGADRLRARAERAGRRRHPGAPRRGARRSQLELALDAHDNPGLVLGAAIAGTSPLKDKLGIVADGTHIVGFGDWAEQLIAESTGKDGKRHPAGRPRRRLPRAVAGPARPADRAARRERARHPRCRRGRDRGLRHARRPVAGVGVRHCGRGRLPRHQSLRPAGCRVGQDRHARAARRRPEAATSLRGGAIEVRTAGPLGGRRSTLAAAVDALLDDLPERVRRDSGIPEPGRSPPGRRVPRSCWPLARSGRSRSDGGLGSCIRPGSSTRAGPPSASSSRSSLPSEGAGERISRSRTARSPSGS